VNNGSAEEGTALVNKGEPYDGPPCERCGYLHATENCCAKRHANGTMLHIGVFYKEAGQEDIGKENSLDSKASHLSFDENVSSSNESDGTPIQLGA